MKKLLIFTGTLLVAYAPCMCTSVDFFSAMWKEHEEHLQRMEQVFKRFEEDVYKGIQEPTQGVQVSMQHVKYAINKNDTSLELVFDNLAADKDTIKSHFDEVRKKIEIIPDRTDGNTKINVWLRPYLQKYVLTGEIAQSAQVHTESKQEKENGKDAEVQKQTVCAATSESFSEILDQRLGLEDAQVHYNKDKKQLRIVLPFIASTKEIPVAVE